MEGHILLVDDNRNDAELALLALESAETAIIVVHSGAEALSLLKASPNPPDLILLDLNMPHMDGLAVLDALRAEGNLQNVPVVILTTSADERDVSRCYAHGASAYVVKPLDFSKFQEVMQSISNFWLKVNRRPPRLA